jgi:hypothetical protein
MSNKITDARLEWLEDTRRRKSMLIKKLEEEEQKLMGEKGAASSADAAAESTPQQNSEGQPDALEKYQLNIDRYKEELLAIEKEFESWQEMGFSLPASKGVETDAST